MHRRQGKGGLAGARRPAPPSFSAFWDAGQPVAIPAQRDGERQIGRHDAVRFGQSQIDTLDRNVTVEIEHIVAPCVFAGLRRFTRPAGIGTNLSDEEWDDLTARVEYGEIAEIVAHGRLVYRQGQDDAVHRGRSGRHNRLAVRKIPRRQVRGVREAHGLRARRECPGKTTTNARERAFHEVCDARGGSGE